jgi:hypothetical protein
LLRLWRQETAEIFEEAVPRLQAGDLELAARAYRRLEAREVWGPHTTAYLLCLEIARGEFESARVTFGMIREGTDPYEKAATIRRVRKLLARMSLDSDDAQEFIELLLTGM